MRYALALLLLALLPACGAGSAVSDDVLADAAAKTVDAGTSRIAVTVTDPHEATLTAEALVDYRASRGRATVTVDAASADDADDFAAELIFVERSIYVKVNAGFGGELPGGKPWLEFERGEDRDVFGPLPDDPTKLLEFLKETSDVAHVGSDDVRGTATEHYRGRLDVGRAIERLPERDRAEAREGARDSGLLEEGLPLEFWIDDAGVLRRVRVELPDEEKKDEPSVGTIDFFDFGVEVDVEPPPADQVATEKMSGLHSFEESGECKQSDDGTYQCEKIVTVGGARCVGPPKDEREANLCAELKKMCAELRKDATEEPEFCTELRRKDDE